jgi:hypothetical protein
LKAAGIHLAITKATQKVHGAHVILNAGALIIKFANSDYKNQVNNTGMFMVIGGAKLNAQATPGFASPAVVTTPPLPAGGSGASSTGTSGTPGTAGTPAIPGTASTSSVPGAGAPDIAPSPALAADPISLPKALSWGWIVAALAVAGVFGFAMKRVPDKVLQTAGPACRLEE